MLGQYFKLKQEHTLTLLSSSLTTHSTIQSRNVQSTDRVAKINDERMSSYLHRASVVSKTLFIVPNDAHYYKIIEMLK